LVVGAEIQQVGTFRRVFCFVYNVTAASVQTVAVHAAEAVFEAAFSHVIAVTAATSKPVRELTSGTAAGDLPAVPIGFPSGS
jgi:hypothetical protein